MTKQELCNALKVALDAFGTEPLKSAQVHVLDQLKYDPRKTVVVIRPVAAEETPQGLGDYDNSFRHDAVLEMEGSFRHADTTANITKAFALEQQIWCVISTNRNISAGGDTAQYAQITASPMQIGPRVENDENAYRIVTVTSAWQYPRESVA